MDAADGAEVARQLPLPILVFVSLLSAATLLLTIRRLDSLPGAFLLIAIWLRVISGAFYSITFAPLGGGLSINSIISVVTVFAGILLVEKRTFSRRWIIPIYILIIVMLLSAIINRSTAGLIDMLFKWGYLIVLIAATHQAMLKSGRDVVLRMVMYCYSPIFIFQILSLILGYGKNTEGADALSYIGGYNHEAVFSVMIATFVATVCLISRINFVYKMGFLVLCVFSILLANYRTAIISCLPLLASAFFIEGLSKFDRKSRAFAIVCMLPVVTLVIVVGADALSERFSDLVMLTTEYDRFIVPPEYFSDADKKILSGRLYIWSNYITAYFKGSDLQLLFGYGPNSWSGVFVKYAHNTIVSYLYELGPLGVVALFYIWFSFLVGTLHVPDSVIRGKLLCAQASFFLFNLSTMPHWQIEGMIFYALVQATVLFQLSEGGRLASSQIAQRPGRQGSRKPIIANRMSTK